MDVYSDPLAKYKNEYGEWKGGVRPPNVIERPEDVEWITDPDHPERRHGKATRLVCGFCGDSRQVRTPAEGAKWYRKHTCEGEGVPIEIWLAA